MAGPTKATITIIKDKAAAQFAIGEFPFQPSKPGMKQSGKNSGGQHRLKKRTGNQIAEIERQSRGNGQKDQLVSSLVISRHVPA